MRLKQIIEDDDSKAGRLFDGFIQVLIVASLISFSLETLPDLSPHLRRVLERVEIGIVIIFTLEYILRVYVANHKRRFIFSVSGLIDLLAILPFYVTTGVDLRSIRVFRLFRIFSVLKLFRYSRAIRRFKRVFVLIREELVLFLLACSFLIFMASVGIYYFENSAQPEVFASVFHSMWWAVITLTTVGYGEIYPITIGGRIFTFVILMIGLGIIAVPAGLVASALSKTLKEEESELPPPVN